MVFFIILYSGDTNPFPFPFQFQFQFKIIYCIKYPKLWAGSSDNGNSIGDDDDGGSGSGSGSWLVNSLEQNFFRDYLFFFDAGYFFFFFHYNHFKSFIHSLLPLSVTRSTKINQDQPLFFILFFLFFSDFEFCFLVIDSKCDIIIIMNIHSFIH